MHAKGLWSVYLVTDAYIQAFMNTGIDKKLYDSFQAIVKHIWGIKDKIPIHKTCSSPFLVFLPLERNIIKHSISIPGWRLAEV